ncbi:hypothetical protein TSTA_105180 [Talaromyces stipitatus ATCC 10500]|uniref:C2H2-type domain-containing protein n=1 Tax=Talaromyces stipitatus (strain ATCC 10500 / CBS 375.48 / QM 6759 / NRRL 1006) TaxID=441959 RepID=B8MP67_TALSN|nr:uncharacterized protein TSTA_105180 [Talaromyces stipitatus ATCC 10500]EED14306.1 hypothetical protein TSTA_105180 [Talaromyces stipitatus ATCC 10500]
MSSSLRVFKKSLILLSALVISSIPYNMAIAKNIRCKCGKRFATVEAMTQHTSDSPLHAQERAQPAADRDTGNETSTHNPSITDNKSQSSTLHWTKEPIAFVKAGANQPTKSWRKGGKAQRNGSNSYHSGSSYGEDYSDIGDNHALCDKDCGWCGHCADYVDY